MFALDAGLSGRDNVDVVLKTNPRFSWRPTLSTSSIAGREQPRVMLNSFEYEIYFVLATLSYAQTLQALSLLSPLNSTSSAAPTPEARTSAVITATKHLLASASIHALLSSRADTLALTTPTTPPCVDVSPSVLRALSHLAHAEATLLAVAKDDPYPSAASQTASSSDKEWMIRAPPIPRVKAHLYARLCLAGSQHAATAHDLLKGDGGGKGGGKVDDDLVTYADEIARVGRARACRFLAIDKDASNGTGEAIAWVRAALHNLGLRSSFEDENAEKKSRLGFSRMKSAMKEKQVDAKTEGELADEARVLRALEKKWMKENDTIMTQSVPEWMPLLAQLPSGREFHTVKAWEPPTLAPGVLANLRAPPEGRDEDQASDSDDEKQTPVPGAFVAGGSGYF